MRANFSTDVEADRATGLFGERAVRHNFIRKVYFILCIQLLVTLGIVSIFMFVEEVQDFVIENPAVAIIALVIMAVCCIILACFTEFRRTPPMNYICLGCFTLAEAYLLGCICTRIDPMIVLTALGITAAVCFGLTIFALQTKCDFTILGGFLFVCCIIGLIVGIFMIFFHNRTMQIVYCSLGVLLFSLYLIFDTQAMLGGNHAYSIEPDEYVFGALNLYIDLCQIFLCILRLLILDD